MSGSRELFDLVVIGAGINGAGIARDAAGRGLRVLICDKGDIAGATSSASTKLIHGGLRYLEHYAFALVREALAEREVMLRIAPHLVREQRFVIPRAAAGRSPWMIWLGLQLYDRLGGRSSLQRCEAYRLGSQDPWGAPLAAGIRDGFAYSDLCIDDARLTLLNVLSAAEMGASVLPRTRVEQARRIGKRWYVGLTDETGQGMEIAARAVVNAAGPWAQRVRERLIRAGDSHALRLVKGSHIVVPRLYEGEHAYVLQNADRRIVFVLPFEGQFSLIGTTEVAVDDPDTPVSVSEAEVDYLCRTAAAWLSTAPKPCDVVWSYAGVRSLYDDGTPDASAVSREYRLIIDGGSGQPPVLSVFGGKLTTYRPLAERALARLRPWFPNLPPRWTAEAPLPGGNLEGRSPQELAGELRRSHPRLAPEWLHALVARYGTRACMVLEGVLTNDDRGRHFGAGLYACEVEYMMRHEWACTAEDILWRRTKLGLRLGESQHRCLAEFLRGGATTLA
jgi:glycerol-3-phosphate dehydrogenase